VQITQKGDFVELKKKKFRDGTVENNVQTPVKQKQVCSAGIDTAY